MQPVKTAVSLGTLVLLASCFIAGCGSDTNQPGPAGNEIQDFLDQNPEMVASPEDAPADEAAEFEAGNS
jgi:hypothetical protein